MGLRRKGREIALQTLYALYFNETDPYLGDLALLGVWPDTMAGIVEGYTDTPDEKSVEFASTLIEGTIRSLGQIDTLIEKHLINWDMERVSVLDKSLLRISVFQLLDEAAAAPVIINEAIEIAKRFCSENSAKFINGVLHAISQELGKSTSKN